MYVCMYVFMYIRELAFEAFCALNFCMYSVMHCFLLQKNL